MISDRASGLANAGRRSGRLRPVLGQIDQFTSAPPEAKAFEPIWSGDNHAEWMRNLHSGMGIPIDKIGYRRGEMERAFPAANVPAPPTLVATIQDVSKTAARRKDAHVVATAVNAKEAVIVTHNIRDFSPEVLSRYGLTKIRPDAFCVGLLAGHETQVLAGIRIIWLIVDRSTLMGSLVRSGGITGGVCSQRRRIRLTQLVTELLELQSHFVSI
jgi:hypothetical protein